ncbi:MAG: hypothetical protein FWD39_05285 [Clostridiales bacterium]|nr:hypothetical protein [Clostridiales bacterium]
MIKVTGILLIIYGALGLASSASALSEPFPSIFGFFGMSYGAYIATTLFGLLVMACFLAFGIFGVSTAGNAAKAQVIINMGIIMCALTVIDLIATIVAADTTIVGRLFVAFAIFGAMLSLVLPILYIIGGSIRKNNLQP